MSNPSKAQRRSAAIVQWVCFGLAGGLILFAIARAVFG